MIATMCASVNEPRNGEPRWPLVPKLTSWFGFIRVRLALVIRLLEPAESTRIAFGAGLPASGEIVVRSFVVCATVSPRRRPATARARLCMPDISRILGDGAVARELAGAGDVEDRFVRPCVGSA